MEQILTDTTFFEMYKQLPQDLKIAVKTFMEVLAKNYKSEYLNNEPKKTEREFGIGKGIVEYMSPDFDEPLDDMKEYMF